MSGLNQMMSPSPSPYQNLSSDIGTEDANASDLQAGIDDAKARFKAASDQFHANPGKNEEAIYNQAYQDLLNRTNRQGAVTTKARQLEIQQKMNQPKVKTNDFTTPDGSQGIEFDKGLDLQAAPKKTSGIDLNALLKMAGNAVEPSAEAGEVKSPIVQEPAIPGPYSLANRSPAVLPTKPAQATPEALANRGAAIINDARAAGVGKIGDRFNVTGNEKGGTIDTRNQIISPDEYNSLAATARSTPEWQRQASGLDDLDNLVQLQAQRNAKKSNVDLSPLGAYLDYNNALRGFGKTDLAANLKGEPIEDTSIKDLGDIQRRRADLSKELVNTIRAAKFGTYSAQDLFNNNLSAGVQPPRPTNPFGAAHLGLSGVQDLKKATDSAYKDNDEQLKAINTISQRVANSATNKAEMGSLPALLEVMDTGSKRILAGVLNMEGYDPSIPGQIATAFTKATQGMIPAQQRAYLQDRLTKAAQRATDQRNAIQADLHNYAGSLPVSPNDVKNIVDSHHTMATKAFPSAVKAGMGGSAATTNPDPASEQSDFDKFSAMMDAHAAAKKAQAAGK